MAVTEEAFERVRERVSKVERDQAVKVATDEGIEERLTKIENSIVWLTRTIVGAIVLSVLAFFIKNGGAGIV